jgi:nucleoside-diphosphate-sugar epimerase
MKNLCFVTGTGGYLGSRVKDALQQRGWEVGDLSRRGAKPFQLGEEISPAALSGAAALVHCAYDFSLVSWPGIHRVNVAGSERLFRAASEAKIQSLIYISSISAFEGCRSLYGRAKLETEKIALGHGATVIRPGLIWGNPPGAMFAQLKKQVSGARILPLFGGGRQIQFLVNDADLAGFICDCADGKIPRQKTPVTVAHEQPWTFRQLLEEIGRAEGKKNLFIPVPWRLIWLPIKCAELCGISLKFRSDSLVSLMNQNPSPSFTEVRALSFPCRPFKM